MRFLHFILNEMPTLPAIDIDCAYKHHVGGPLNGKENLYSYDAVAEVMDNEEHKKRMLLGYYQKKYPVPIVCKSDLKVFMWDGKTRTYAPRTKEDIYFCEEFIKALNSEKSKERNDFDFSKAEILKPEEEK